MPEQLSGVPAAPEPAVDVSDAALPTSGTAPATPERVDLLPPPVGSPHQLLSPAPPEGTAASGQIAVGRVGPGVTRRILRPAMPAGQAPMPPQVRTITVHPLAKVSLTLGILSVFHWALGVAAIVTGATALILIHRTSRAPEDPIDRPGRGLAVAGVAMGALFAVLFATGGMDRLGDADGESVPKPLRTDCRERA